jgi:AcrR family transcriptional regulator
MARKYQMKARAERQEETRRRIVEAAIDLHRTIGPAQTSFSAIAERAGVQRHTLYRHFPDERAMGLACSGLYSERNPLPDPAPWREIGDPEERLRAGLAALYAYFEANKDMLACVIRDGEIDPLVRELSDLRFGPGIMAIAEALGEVLPRPRSKATRAALELALDFGSWQLLVGRNGLTSRQAADQMARATLCGSRQAA